MIEKILDKYYAKKLQILINRISLKWYLDRKFEIDNQKFVFRVKIPEYNDKQYVPIFVLPITDVYLYISNYELCKRDIENLIKNYIKEEKEKD